MWCIRKYGLTCKKLGACTLGSAINSTASTAVHTSASSTSDGCVGTASGSLKASGASASESVSSWRAGAVIQARIADAWVWFFAQEASEFGCACARSYIVAFVYASAAIQTWVWTTNTICKIKKKIEKLLKVVKHFKPELLTCCCSWG